MALERVQKILANAGFCSRRKAEELIDEGKVFVNGEKIKLGDKADSDKDIIMIGNKKVEFDRKRYLALYKPSRIMTTLSDPSNKPNVTKFLGGINERVFPIGRLDYDAEGLLILTNDGDFANRVMHPRYEVVKTYQAELKNRIRPEEIRKLRGKIKLKDGFVKIENVKLIQGNYVEISIHEGRHKIVKRIFNELGFYVSRLKRTKIGIISLGKLRPGQLRELTKEEIESFKSH